MNNTRYTFGTSEIAAARLGKLAEVFNSHSTQFIRSRVNTPVASAIDVGCGPGFTTHMLSMALDSKEVYGMDASEEFLIKAMDRYSDCVFIMHNVEETPFPITADLMYMRFVLSHMPNPVRLINRWVNEINDGGLILLEEVEGIETDVELFKNYLEINAELVASAGAALFVGKTLSRGRYEADIIANESFELPVKNSDAAAMFYPNTVSIWENEGFVLQNYSAERRKKISSGLREMMDPGYKDAGITWKMRRIVLRKNEYADCSLFI